MLDESNKILKCNYEIGTIYSTATVLLPASSSLKFLPLHIENILLFKAQKCVVDSWIGHGESLAVALHIREKSLVICSKKTNLKDEEHNIILKLRIILQ